MTTAKALFAGLALIAGAVFVGQIAVPVQADAMLGGNYTMTTPHTTGDTAALLWRINGATGQVSTCILDESVVKKPPVCSPWSR